jgi:hypothetical protein
LSTNFYGNSNFTQGQTPTLTLFGTFGANANEGTIACTPSSSSVTFTVRVLPAGNSLGQIVLYLETQTNALRYNMSGQASITLPQLPVGSYTIALEGFSGVAIPYFKKFSILAPNAPTPPQNKALAPILNIFVED